MQIPTPTQKKSIPWASVFQFGFSMMSALAILGFAFSIVLLSLSELMVMPDNQEAAMPMLLMAAGMTFIGMLLIPSAVFSFLKIIGRSEVMSAWLAAKQNFLQKFVRPVFLMILFPIVVGLGYWVAQNKIFGWLVLPPLHVIAVAISVLWLLLLGLKGLSVGSGQRAWGVFSGGLILAPLFSLIVELVLMLVLGILGVVILSQDPILAGKLEQLSESILLDPNQPPDAQIRLLEPYLRQPVIVYVGLVFGAVLVPLIEELFKPIGVWFLVGRKISPAQGFAAGLISGAGYAIFENFTLSASSGEEWAAVVIARVGTSLIHILTTGLTGWALALAWREGKYLRLGLTYLTSVAIHALWNGTVILTIAPELLPVESSYPAALRNIGAASPIVFGVLLIGSFVVFLMSNRLMRRAASPPSGV